jgi:hypothetical protein
MRRRAGAWAILAWAVTLAAACGVKAPPRPPVDATRPAAHRAPAQGSEPGAGGDAAPEADCGPRAATPQGSER